MKISREMFVRLLMIIPLKKWLQNLHLTCNECGHISLSRAELKKNHLRQDIQISHSLYARQHLHNNY